MMSAETVQSTYERSLLERRKGDRRQVAGTGPGGVERRKGDRRKAVADRRSENNIQLATFYLNGEFYGIPVERVQEILLAQEPTPVPNSDPVISGLINLRGQIVTAIDLRKVLGIPDREEGRSCVNIIVRFPDGADSLLVDEIGDVLEVSELRIEPPPPSIEGIEKKFVDGVCKLDDTLLIILDVDRIAGRAD